VEYVTRDDKINRVTELKQGLASRAIEYPGVLPTDVQAAWDADTAEIDALERDIAAWDDRQATLKRYAEEDVNKPGAEKRSYPAVASFVRKTEADIYDVSAPERAGSPEGRAQMYRDNAMRAVETARYAHPAADLDKTRAQLSRWVDTIDTSDKELARRIITTGSPLYYRAFTKYVAGRPLSPEEQRAGALTVQTDATGGFAVPFWLDPTLVAAGAHTSINPYRRACKVIPIVGTDTYHGVTAAAAVVTRAAENAAVTEGGPAIGQISAIVGKVHGMVTMSKELLQDRPDIASEMAVLIAEAKDTEEESIFTIGIGDALGAGYNPIGMLPAHGTAGAFTHTDTAVSVTLSIGDLYVLEAALPVRHRMNAQWFMGRTTLRTIQGMETVGGQLFGGVNYARTPDPENTPTGNTGTTLLGYPVNEVPSAPTGLVANTPVACLCDPQKFYVIERVGMTVELIQNLWAAAQMPTGQSGLYAWWRNTAKPADINAGRIMTILT
jgi:HK97 family phage major capsid protein